MTPLSDYIIEHSFDIVAFTETWLRNTPDDDQIIRALTIPGYKFTHVPRRQHKNTTARGGGIAILRKSNIKMASKSSWKTNSFENMEVTLSASSTVKLAVIYRPPPSKRNKSTVGLFLSEFQDFLQHHVVKSQNTLILGDFNFHYEDQLNTDASRFRDILSNHSLCQHVSGPTHMDGHTLDLIITKLTDNLVSKTTVSDFLTDRGAVHCDLHLPKPQPLRESVQYRNYAAIDKEMFRVDIEASTLCLDPATSAASLLEQYDTNLSALLGKHAPVQTRTITVRPKVPWFSGDIKMAKQKRRQLERKWRQSRLTIYRDLFKQQRRHVNQLISSAKSTYYTAKITEAASDHKQLYNVVNALLIKPEAILPDGGSLEQLANRFSASFQDKVRLIQENLTLKADPNYVPPDESPGTVDNKLSIFLPATEDEVRRLINKSPSKSCALDPVPTWFLKEHLDCLLPSITNIVNLSMSTGIVPTKMKAALVTRLLKKPSLDKDVMKNFRPVSNLSFISKLTERVVLNRLIDHVSRNNLQEKFQSAYKPNHSTETALMRIQNDILMTLDNKRGVLLFLLDLTAAFDTVDHTLLLACMRSAGVIGVAHKWFESYLTSRTQTVCLGQTQSDPSELLQGVPQGSVLGPVLFTLYTGPIGQLVRRHRLDFHLFADDSQLYVSFKIKDTNDEMAALARTQACMGELKAWMIHHRLQLNDDKTEVPVITTPSSASKHSLTDVVIGDSILQPTAVARNIGVMFDSELSMKSQVSKLCKVAYFHLHRIRSIRDCLTQHATELLVHSRTGLWKWPPLWCT